MTRPTPSRLALALVALALAVAGCATPADNDDMTPTTGTTSTPMTPTPTTPTPTYEPAPKGDALAANDIAALAAVFNDAPLTGGQEPWPGHLVKWVTNDTFVLLHFDADDPLQATKLLWTGLGVKGVFCKEDQPGAEFTHFHKKNAATYAEGHGGETGEEGYWLTHVAVLDFESPFGRTGHPGVHHEFGPTPAPDCGDNVPSKDFDAPGSGELTAADIAALATVFDDNVLRGGQEPWPGHLTKWVNDDVFLLMHFDNDTVLQATKALWYGIGVRSTFCNSTQPGPEFPHFHSAHATTYAGGHGGQANQPGYWLLHLNVRDFESPFGATGRPGVHEAFGPTPPPTC